MKKILIWLLILALLLCSGCAVAKKADIQAVIYPEEAVMQLSSSQLRSFTDRPSSSNTYEGCKGLDGTSLVYSPYFNASADGKEIPSYATPVYSEQLGGQLHSFTTILVKPHASSGFNITFKLETSFSLKQVQVLPEASSVEFEKNSVTATFSSYGTYTFLFNGRQAYPFTVYIREYVDESSDIASYKEKYGNENVIVYDTGFYNVNKMDLSSDSVVYLKRGAFLRAEKTYEILNAEDEAAAQDKSAFFNIANKSNVIIKGNGIVDFTAHWLHSRQAVAAVSSQNVTLEDIIFLNPSAWTVYAYRCDNVKINDISVYGYKINSDAVNICNSSDVTLTGCFARTGDDAFSAKSLGSRDGKACEGITFESCYAWAGKARAFGITGEIESLIKDVLFNNCIVLFRDSTWSQTRIGSLVIIAESGEGCVENIAFENIIINSDAANAISLCVENTLRENFTAKNITFKNITAKQTGKSLILCQNPSNAFFANFENVVINDALLTAQTVDNLFNYDSINSFVFNDFS